jgi:hypothetical protein
MNRVEATFQINGHPVTVSVLRLDSAEVDRIAARLAWFAGLAVLPDTDLGATGWPDLLQRIMGDYVSLTVDDDTLGRLEELWTPLCSGALRAFIDVNRIDPAVIRHLLHHPHAALC